MTARRTITPDPCAVYHRLIEAEQRRREAAEGRADVAERQVAALRARVEDLTSRLLELKCDEPTLLEPRE